MKFLCHQFDYSDLQRRFTAQVSALLPHSRPLLKAVFAVSAQHLSAIGEFDSISSDEYYQSALEQVIPMLSASKIENTEEVLAATVILRLRAEFERS